MRKDMMVGCAFVVVIEVSIATAMIIHYEND